MHKRGKKKQNAYWATTMTWPLLSPLFRLYRRPSSFRPCPFACASFLFHPSPSSGSACFVVSRAYRPCDLSASTVKISIEILETSLFEFQPLADKLTHLLLSRSGPLFLLAGRLVPVLG